MFLDGFLAYMYSPRQKILNISVTMQLPVVPVMIVDYYQYLNYFHD